MPNPYAVAPLSISALALSVSVAAFVVALKNYRRKTGMLIKSRFSIMSSIRSNGRYLSSLTLENLKDRAVTIFAIYLKVGSSYFIEIETFEEKPLILKAFESYQNNYGPIDFYGVDTNRIDLDAVLHDPKVKKRLVLSTSDGKYVAPTTLKGWNPVIQFFDNHLTAIVRPVRTIYKGVAMGGKVKFCIELAQHGKKEEIIPIHPKDFEVKLFKNFQLTQKALESKEALEAFLKQQVADGKLACDEFEVVDFTQWREERSSFYSGETIEAKYYGPFQYYVFGKVHTIYANWRLKRDNRKRIRGR